MRDFANQKNLLKESDAGHRRQPLDQKRQANVTSNNPPRRYGRWILLAIVVIIAVTVVVRHLPSRHHNPVQQSTQTTKRAHPALITNTQTQKTTPVSQNARTAAKTQEKKSYKPVFDFYTVLPKQKAYSQIPVQTDTQTQQTNQAAQFNKQFILQLASYQNEQMAQQLRSQLILLGLKPTIETTGSGRYRINIGPYDSMRAADKVRHQLQDNGINGAMVQQIQ